MIPITSARESFKISDDVHCMRTTGNGAFHIFISLLYDAGQSHAFVRFALFVDVSAAIFFVSALFFIALGRPNGDNRFVVGIFARDKNHIFVLRHGYGIFRQVDRGASIDSSFFSQVKFSVK